MPRVARNQPPPFRPGNELTAKIEALPLGPDAIARIRGYVIFVPGALPGEKVRLRVVSANRRFGRGRIVEVVEPSSARAAPFCPIYQECGGCHLQHLEEAARREHKRKLLESELAHHLGRELPVAPAAPQLDRGYRDKCALVCAPGPDGKLRAGFYRAGSHELVELPERGCPVQQPQAMSLALRTVEVLRELGVRAWDEDRGAGQVRYVMTRAGKGTGETALVIVLAGGARPPWTAEFIKKLKACKPSPTCVAFNWSPQGDSDLVLGEKTELISGAPRYRTEIEGILYQVSPTSFFQTSSGGAAALVRAMRRMLGGVRELPVLDLYGGAGLIGLALARDGADVLIVDGNPASIGDARATARAEGLRAEARRNSVERALARLVDDGARPEIVILDPPRGGCAAGVLRQLADGLAPARIVYASCDPPALSRDLALLEQSGYRLREAEAVDMFPHAWHVEAVAILERGSERLPRKHESAKR